jgi:hypothetical protein
MFFVQSNNIHAQPICAVLNINLRLINHTANSSTAPATEKRTVTIMAKILHSDRHDTIERFFIEKFYIPPFEIRAGEIIIIEIPGGPYYEGCAQIFLKSFQQYKKMKM